LSGEALRRGLDLIDLDVAMLAHLTRVEHAAPFVAALRGHFHSDLKVFAVARELHHRADLPAPVVVNAICDALLGAADSDAQPRLYLATLAPLLERLGGEAAVAAIAAAARPRAGLLPAA